MKRFFLLKLSILYVIVGLNPATVRADTNVWTNIGPAGPSAALPAFDPQNPAVVYIGGLGVHGSRDAGATWSDLGLIGWSISKVFVDPQNTGTLYAQAFFLPDEDADEIVKIFKSTDGGATWNDLVSGATLLAIDPQVSTTLYALAGGYQPGLFKSTDGGAGWTRLSGFPNGLSPLGLAIDWQSHNTLYVPLMGVVAGRNVAMLVKSTDGGASWKQSDSGLPSAEPNFFPFTPNGISIDPKNASTVYATKMAGGVYKSTDGGATWRAANLGINTISGALTCCNGGVSIDTQNPNTLYVTGSYPPNLIYKSINGGVSWSALNSQSAMGFQAVVLDPTGALYLPAPAPGGLRKSTDGGASWETLNIRMGAPVSSLAIDAQSTLYAAGYPAFKSNPISRSTDAGASWAQGYTGLPSGYGIVALAVDAQNPGNVYAATSIYECGNDPHAGIYKSADGGVSWTDTRSGIGCRVTAIVTDPQNAGTVYAGGMDRGVYKSTDGGVSWSAINAGLPGGFAGPAVSALAVDPQNSGTVYAAAAAGIFQSTDGGASWSSTGLKAAAAALAIDPQHTTTVYAATMTGLFQSTDGGVSWQNLFPSAPGGVFAVAIDPQTSGKIYAGTDAGVWQTVDGGASWTPIAGGPVHVRVLLLDPQDSGTVYAGGPDGLFAITLAPASRPASAYVSLN